MKVAFLGDLHSEYDILLTPPPVRRVIQVGDFGFIHRNPCTITPLIETWFIDGNHDSIELLHNLESDDDGPICISPNLFYIRRGSVLKVGNSVVGFLGGAESIDRADRIEGLNWFSEEWIRYKDTKQLEWNLSKFDKLDVLVAHAAPARTVVKMLHREPLSSAKILDEVIKYLHPRLVICGHIHTACIDRTSYEDTIVHVLDIHEFRTFDL